MRELETPAIIAASPQLLAAVDEANAVYNEIEVDLTAARLQLGIALNAVRSTFPHGTWEPYLESRGIPSQRASEAMRAADMWSGKSPSVGDLEKGPSIKEVRAKRLPRSPKAGEQPDPLPGMTPTAPSPALPALQGELISVEVVESPQSIEHAFAALGPETVRTAVENLGALVAKLQARLAAAAPQANVPMPPTRPTLSLVAPNHTPWWQGEADIKPPTPPSQTFRLMEALLHELQRPVMQALVDLTGDRSFTEADLLGALDDCGDDAATVAARFTSLASNLGWISAASDTQDQAEDDEGDGQENSPEWNTEAEALQRDMNLIGKRWESFT